MNKLPPRVWVDRCAQRIVELDHEIAGNEAQAIALAMRTFERTRAMAPENAVDFVAWQLARPKTTRFERRAIPRA